MNKSPALLKCEVWRRISLVCLQWHRGKHPSTRTLDQTDESRRHNMMIPVKAFLSRGLYCPREKMSANFSWIADTVHSLQDIKEASNTSLLSWKCRLMSTIFFFRYWTIQRDNCAFFGKKNMEQDKKKYPLGQYNSFSTFQ